MDPAPDGFVGDLDAALCEEILDVAIAEGEAEIHPDGALDDVGREAVAKIGRSGHIPCYGGSRRASPRT